MSLSSHTLCYFFFLGAPIYPQGRIQPSRCMPRTFNSRHFLGGPCHLYECTVLLFLHPPSFKAPVVLRRRKRLGKRPVLSTTRSFPLFSCAFYPDGKTGMSGLQTFHTLYSQFSFRLYWLGWAGLYELSTPHIFYSYCKTVPVGPHCRGKLGELDPCKPYLWKGN